MSYQVIRFIRKAAARLTWYARSVHKVLLWTITLQLVSQLRLRQRRRFEALLIASSDLFDREWYLKENPDVRSTGDDPATHYLVFGATGGQDPGPLFDSDWYLNQNPDVRQAGANPLVHYLEHGAIEGRLPKPLLDSAWSPPHSPKSDLLTGDRHSARWQEVIAVSKRLQTEDISSHVARKTSTMESVSSGCRRWAADGEIVENRTALNIVFINYGSFNNNSASHIVGFANALADRGHNIVMCAKGNPHKAADFGIPQFRSMARDTLAAKPEALRDILDDIPTLIHCWTPRENARLAATAVIERFGCPYFIHLEDNEELVTRSQLGLTAAQASRRSGRDWDETIPSTLSHPLRARNFIAGAAGITIIVDALRTIVPNDLPIHLLEPGLDDALLSPGLDPNGRSQLRRELDVPSDARIIVYPGNVHAANAEEVLGLYAAIHMLNRRGMKVHLIRTGLDSGHDHVDALRRLSRKHVTHLGWIDRRYLVDIIKLSDVFVQPGTVDEFNRYRLPSKLMDFFTAGRPVILPATNLGLRLRDGIDALLLRRGDATEIAERVAEVLHQNDLADRLGRNARRFAVENFNWQRSALGLDNFYRAALAAWRDSSSARTER